MSKTLFGTDGVRGTPGTFPLDAVTIWRLGAAVVRELGAGPRLLVGCDTRESGAWIERWLASGVAMAGGTLVSVGVMPTPAVAHLVASRGCHAGIVISASHNPFPDNGIKILTATGEKASRDLEARIEARVADDAWEPPVAAPAPLETINLTDNYVVRLRHIVSGAPRLDAWRIAVDCAHGATSAVAPGVLRELGFEVVALNTSPDGRNINAACGSTHPEELQAVVVERRCRLGLAFDGDGDRVILVDHRGALVDGDAVMFICARHLKALGRLVGDAVVATVMSNIGLEVALHDLGIVVHRCAVGDWHVREEMVRRGVGLGGEQSGHIIFADLLPTGDGLATALCVLRVVAETGQELANLVGDLRIFPQLLVNVPVKDKRAFDRVPEISQAIQEAERQLAGEGRVLIRYSGTEPLLRIMIEGRDMAVVQRLAGSIAERARQHLG